MIMVHTGRTCGECSACCTTHQVSEVNKPVGVTCLHCADGGGCKIYSTRPEPRRVYQCLWLRGALLEDHRPDKSGIVCELRNSEVGYVVILREYWSGAIDGLAAQTMMKVARNNGYIIHAKCLAEDGTPFEFVESKGVKVRV